MSDITIEVQPRTETGKNANRRLRAAGMVPAVVYGDRKDPVPIRVNSTSIEALLRSEGGENAVFLLKLEGTAQSRHAMIREMQVNPTNGAMIHLDFIRINMTETVEVEVPIDLHGEAEGVRNQGGFLDFVTRVVQISCLPADIPPAIALDVTALEIGHHIEIGQLDLPDNVLLLDEEDRVIVSVHAPRIEEEEEEEEEEGLIEAPTAEPEVVGQESEDEG